MRKSSGRHRLINRTSELFVGDPHLPEFPASPVTDVSTDVSVLVKLQLSKDSKPTPRRDEKTRCSVLFSGKKQKDKHSDCQQDAASPSLSAAATSKQSAAKGRSNRRKVTGSVSLRQRVGQILEDDDFTPEPASVPRSKDATIPRVSQVDDSDVTNEAVLPLKKDATVPVDQIVDDSRATKEAVLPLKDAVVRVDRLSDNYEFTGDAVPLKKDAAVQAVLCQCTKFVTQFISVQRDTDNALLSSLGEEAVMTRGHIDGIHCCNDGSRLAVSSKPSTNNEVPPVGAAELNKAVDVEEICNELAECELDDTVEYQYAVEKSDPDGAAGMAVSNTELSGDVNSGDVPAMQDVVDEACVSHIDASLPDQSVVISKADQSSVGDDIQPSVDSCVSESVTLELPATGAAEDAKDDADAEDAGKGDTKLDGNEIGMVRFSSDLFSVVSSTAAASALADSSKLDDDVFELSDHVAACSHDEADALVSDVCVLPALGNSSNLEPLRDVIRPSASVNVVSTDGIMTSSSVAEASAPTVCQDGAHLLDDQTSELPRMLSSTAVGSPEAISQFFGLAGSSLSGSGGQTAGNKKRKSKCGKKRVSMCGEYVTSPPAEFYTPLRLTTDTNTGDLLTAIPDTDEEDLDSPLNSIMYKTAVEGSDDCVPDTPSDADADDEDDFEREFPESDSDGYTSDDSLSESDDDDDDDDAGDKSEHESEKLLPLPHGGVIDSISETDQEDPEAGSPKPLINGCSSGDRHENGGYSEQELAPPAPGGSAVGSVAKTEQDSKLEPGEPVEDEVAVTLPSSDVKQEPAKPVPDFGSLSDFSDSDKDFRRDSGKKTGATANHPVSRRRESSESSDDAFEQFLQKQKTKTSGAVLQSAKSNWRAPMKDFIVSDDEVDDDDESDIEQYGRYSAPAVTRSGSDKENQPLTGGGLPSDGGKRKLKDKGLDTLTSTLRDTQLKPDSIFVHPAAVLPIRTKSATELETARPKTMTPVSANISRQRTAPVPHTVAHCHVRRVSFLKSLSSDVPWFQRDADASRYLKQFAKLKAELTNKLFKLFNSEVFNNKMPTDMAISWSPRLTKTAGFCRYKSDRANPMVKMVSIELSTKVCDSAERLRDTLIHELCHAMVWIEHKVIDGHGRLWKYWARTANRLLPDLPPITRCHTYSINAKYIYKCTRCGYEIRRHSNSLDTAAKVCGYCGATFQLLYGNSKSAATPRTPNPFALFVRDNYASIKRSQPGMKHGEVMSAIKTQYQQAKSASNPIAFTLDEA